jgi:adenylate cyclase
MIRRARIYQVWLLPLAIVAVAIAFVAFDPFSLETRFAQLEFDLFRQLAPPGGAATSVSSIAAQILFLEIFGTALAILFAFRQALWAVALAVLAVAAAQGASWFLYARHGILCDTATASASLLAAAFAGIVGSLLARRRRRGGGPVVQKPADDRGRSLHPAIDSRLVASLSCGLRRAPEIAGAFAGDAAGFTRFVEEALAPLVDETVRRGATPGHFDGTSFSAHWEAVRHGAGYADEACDAAERLIADIAGLNDSHAREHDESAANLVEIGMGLSAGPAIVGGVRTQQRVVTCVAGPGADLAERLRRLSARYGPAVLASSHIREAARRAHAFLELDFAGFEPDEQPVRLYALLGNPLLGASPKFRAVAAFHEHIFQALRARDWEKARALIEQCRKLSGVSGKVYDLHLARIAWYEANPPPPGWDGGFRAAVR